MDALQQASSGVTRAIETVTRHNRSGSQPLTPPRSSIICACVKKYVYQLPHIDLERWRTKAVDYLQDPHIDSLSVVASYASLGQDVGIDALEHERDCLRRVSFRMRHGTGAGPHAWGISLVHIDANLQSVGPPEQNRRRRSSVALKARPVASPAIPRPVGTTPPDREDARTSGRAWQ
jgi:hypothetical protein